MCLVRETRTRRSERGPRGVEGKGWGGSSGQQQCRACHRVWAEVEKPSGEGEGRNGLLDSSLGVYSSPIVVADPGRHFLVGREFLPEVRECIRDTKLNKHDTGWAKGAPSEDHNTKHNANPEPKRTRNYNIERMLQQHTIPRQNPHRIEL